MRELPPLGKHTVVRLSRQGGVAPLHALSKPREIESCQYDSTQRGRICSVLERCLPEECGATDPLMAPVKARARRGLDDGEKLRYGADLKCRKPGGERSGAAAVEWIGNRHEVSLTVAGVADGKGNVKKPGATEPGKRP